MDFAGAVAHDESSRFRIGDAMSENACDDSRAPEGDEAYDAWFRREIGAGLAAADAGGLLSADEVEAEAATWRAALLRKLSGAAA
jgi:predicted transcriptional regulator